MDRNQPFPSGSQDSQDFDPWSAPSTDFPESWSDPVEERALLRMRLQRYRFGFSFLGLALVIASLSSLGFLLLLFTHQRHQLGILLGSSNWNLIVESSVVWLSLLGVCALWGRWPDENWQRRSGILLMMCIADAVLWALDNASMLGLEDSLAAHKWFFYSLGKALGWSEFALIASLAADMAAHLGETQAIDFAKAVRSLTTTAAMVWFMWFYFVTNWKPPFWPLRPRMANGGLQMLSLGWMVLGAILLVQVTGLTLLAGRCCGRALRDMAEQDRKNDLLPSRSEVGWEEFTRPQSGPKGGA